MKKTALLAFVLVLLSSAVVVRFTSPVIAEGTIYIKADGSIEPPTANITSVDNITYTFTGNINDSIVVERDNIVIDGAGYTLQGTGSGMGILLSGRSDVTIKNMGIEAFGYGVYLWHSSNNTISGNNITNNEEGIRLYEDTEYNTISRNNITENSDYGIRLWGSSNNIVSRNNLTNNGDGIELFSSSNYNSISGNNITNNSGYGVYLGCYLRNNVLRNNSMVDNRYNFGVERVSLPYINDVDTSNTVDGKPIYYWVNRQNEEVPSDAGYVALIDSYNITVRGLELKNNGQGILLIDTTNSQIASNNITNNYQGIYLYSSSNNSLFGNNIINNVNGVQFLYSSSNVLRNNSMVDNHFNFGTEGWAVSHFVHDVDTSNTVDGRPVYYIFKLDNLTINPSTYPDVGYLALINSRNVTVEGLELKNNGQGILLINTTNSRIANNNLTNNSLGVYLLWSSNNNIFGNSITNNTDRGVYLSDSSSNTISRNNITNNYYDGVWLWSSPSNIISENNITNHYYGVDLSGSDNNSIFGNNITNNSHGVDLVGSSYNSLFGNNITNNKYQGLHLGLSSNNKIFHNNFIDNGRQAYTYESTNVWDDGYPSGGNYWSDYTDVDVYSGSGQNVMGSDGIGDLSYDIDADNRDRYPLMGPISFFNACTWDETTYHVHTVSNSTISDFYFSRDDKLVSFNVNGTDDPVGFCRVTIPNVIVQDLWQGNYTVLVDGEEPIMMNNWTDGTYTYIYITYLHSEHKVTIIPEFPTCTSMLLILIVLTVATAIYKRRLLKTPIH